MREYFQKLKSLEGNGKVELDLHIIMQENQILKMQQLLMQQISLK